MHAYKSIALLSVLSIGLTFNPSVTQAYSTSKTLSKLSLEEYNHQSQKNPSSPTPKCPGTPGCDRRADAQSNSGSEPRQLALKTETQERASGRAKLPVSGSFSQTQTKARASGRSKLPVSGSFSQTQTKARASGRSKLPVSGSFSQTQTKARASGRREIDNHTENNEKCERASGRFHDYISVENCRFHTLSNPSPL